MIVDVLAFSPHPDDVEIQCGGTLLKLAKQGYKTGIIDLTRGEMGTRGTPEERDREAQNAAKILQVSVRENLKLPDSKLSLQEDYRTKIAQVIRKYQPKIILAPYFEDSHPDHAYTGKLVFEGAFIAGLRKYQLSETEENTPSLPPSRPATILYYMNHYEFAVRFVIDVTEFQEQKWQAIECYKSQLYQKNSQEPKTNISSPDYRERNELRSRFYGESIGVRFGEPFFVRQQVPVQDPVALFGEHPLEWNGIFGIKAL